MVRTKFHTLCGIWYGWGQVSKDSTVSATTHRHLPPSGRATTGTSHCRKFTRLALATGLAEVSKASNTSRAPGRRTNMKQRHKVPAAEVANVRRRRRRDQRDDSVYPTRMDARKSNGERGSRRGCFGVKNGDDAGRTTEGVLVISRIGWLRRRWCFLGSQNSDSPKYPNSLSFLPFPNR